MIGIKGPQGPQQPSLQPQAYLGFRQVRVRILDLPYIWAVTLTWCLGVFLIHNIDNNA